MSEYSHHHLTEIISWLQKDDDPVAVLLRNHSIDKIKGYYKSYSSSFLTAAIVRLAELEEYKWCQAFQELLDERVQ